VVEHDWKKKKEKNVELDFTGKENTQQPTWLSKVTYQIFDIFPRSQDIYKFKVLYLHP